MRPTFFKHRFSRKVNRHTDFGKIACIERQNRVTYDHITGISRGIKTWGLHGLITVVD